MHLEETYTGIMRIASNRDGKPYKDWREHYIDQAGLIMIFSRTVDRTNMRFISLCQGECICILHWENCKWMTGK